MDGESGLLGIVIQGVTKFWGEKLCFQAYGFYFIFL